MSKNDINNHLNYVMSFFFLLLLIILFNRYIHKQNLMDEINGIVKGKKAIKMIQKKN